MQKAFKDLGLNLGDDLEDVFLKIDVNQDKYIDEDEFLQFFVTYISEFASSSLAMEQVGNALFCAFPYLLRFLPYK